MRTARGVICTVKPVGWKLFEGGWLQSTNTFLCFHLTAVCSSRTRKVEKVFVSLGSGVITAWRPLESGCCVLCVVAVRGRGDCVHLSPGVLLSCVFSPGGGAACATSAGVTASHAGHSCVLRACPC